MKQSASVIRQLAPVAALVMMGACSATMPDAPGTLSLGSPTGYAAANALFTLGFSEKELAPNQFTVRAKGTAVTPPARLEKIALARAAEIGVEQNMKFFKAAPAVHTIECKDAKALPHKSGKTESTRSPVATLEAVYAKDQADPVFLPSADTFARLSREISEDAVSAEAMAQASSAVTAACGK